jgi:hypothetical protein
MKRKSGLADSPFFISPLPEPEKTVTEVLPPEDPISVKPEKNNHASLQASNIASKQASLLAKMKNMGRLKATNAATFRFPSELLEMLAEAEYQLRKDHHIKATKNIIVVGALARLLCEFEEKTTESSLYKYLASE